MSDEVHLGIITDVSSKRRNPILANEMAQLNYYMEKRDSGLTRICNEPHALGGYKDDLRPVFKSTPTQFQTTIFASADMQNVGDMSETKLSERQRRILDLIKASPTISDRRMSVILSVSQRTIKRDLSALQKNVILRRESFRSVLQQARYRAACSLDRKTARLLNLSCPIS